MARRVHGSTAERGEGTGSAEIAEVNKQLKLWAFIAMLAALFLIFMHLEYIDLMTGAI
jgi:hypothetical protein